MFEVDNFFYLFWIEGLGFRIYGSGLGFRGKRGDLGKTSLTRILSQHTGRASSYKGLGFKSNYN